MPVEKLEEFLITSFKVDEKDLPFLFKLFIDENTMRVKKFKADSVIKHFEQIYPDGYNDPRTFAEIIKIYKQP